MAYGLLLYFMVGAFPMSMNSEEPAFRKPDMKTKW